MLEAAIAALDSQPFSRHVGAGVTAYGDGGTVIEIVVEDHHLQQYGIVHGGLFGYLVINALAFRCRPCSRPEHPQHGLLGQPGRKHVHRHPPRHRHRRPRHGLASRLLRSRSKPSGPMGRATCVITQGTVVKSE